MPKHTLKQFIPSPGRIREIRLLGVLGNWIYESNLWHINRYSASMAFFIGLFVAFVPLPGQMVIAALLAILLRCNLPLSVCLTWVTNPVTMPPIFYLAYRLGALLMDAPMQSVRFQLSWEWASSSLVAIWQPFLLGCLVCGLFFGSLGYFVLNMLWRLHVTRRWHERKLARKLRPAPKRAKRVNSVPGEG